MFPVARLSVDVQSPLRKSAFGTAVATSKSAVKDRLREAQRRWLSKVIDETGKTPTEIARLGGINPSTLTRFRNDARHGGALSPVTIGVISERTGIPIDPEALSRPLPPARPGGFREREAEPYVASSGDPLADAVTSFIAGRVGVDPWTLRTRALEYEGFRPGDVVIVNLNGTPRPGDVVCVQIYDFANGRAQTVFRLYEPPFLIGSGPDEAVRKPRRADEDSVAIKGVVEMTFRRRTGRNES